MFRNAFCAFQYFKEQLKKKLKFSSLFIKKSLQHYYYIALDILSFLIPFISVLRKMDEFYPFLEAFFLAIITVGLFLFFGIFILLTKMFGVL
jgi:hypothetical protein